MARRSFGTAYVAKTEDFGFVIVFFLGSFAEEVVEEDEDEAEALSLRSHDESLEFRR